MAFYILQNFYCSKIIYLFIYIHCSKIPNETPKHYSSDWKICIPVLQRHSFTRACG